MQKRKIAVYIGRFQPLHLAHQENIRHCLNNYDETIVLVGSTNRRSSIKNPFSYNTIKKWITNIDSSVIVKPLKDYIYNETKWITEVEKAVYQEFQGENIEITLVGHSKDESSYYLKRFPNFRNEELPSSFDGISATDVREAFFSPRFFKDSENYQFISENVSYSVLDDMISFCKTEQYEDLMDETRFYQKEKDMFSCYPYLDTLKFTCSDAVVECDGNILLVKRKIAPGKNTWAIPGGFVNSKETFREAAIRELIEETGIKIPKRALEVSIKDSEVFDAPNRNIGIPRISKAFYFQVFPDTVKGQYSKLPKVIGSDDAAEAKWFSIAEIRNMKLFDDHGDIIDYFTKSM